MKHESYSCDRCGGAITSKRFDIQVTVGDRHRPGDYKIVTYQADMCASCVDKFLKDGGLR